MESQHPVSTTIKIEQIDGDEVETELAPTFCDEQTATFSNQSNNFTLAYEPADDEEMIKEEPIFYDENVISEVESASSNRPVLKLSNNQQKKKKKTCHSATAANQLPSTNECYLCKRTVSCVSNLSRHFYENHVEKRVDVEGERFDKMEERFNKMEERFNKMEERYANMYEKRLSIIENKVNAMEATNSVTQKSISDCKKCFHHIAGALGMVSPHNQFSQPKEKNLVEKTVKTVLPVAGPSSSARAVSPIAEPSSGSGPKFPILTVDELLKLNEMLSHQTSRQAFVQRWVIELRKLKQKQKKNMSVGYTLFDVWFIRSLFTSVVACRATEGKIVLIELDGFYRAVKKILSAVDPDFAEEKNVKSFLKSYVHSAPRWSQEKSKNYFSKPIETPEEFDEAIAELMKD